MTLAAVLLASAGGARASDLLDVNASSVTLKVSGSTALVEYRENGRTRHVLLWDAVNARPPVADAPQVSFRRDFSGGWASQHRALWRTFANRCGSYDGPPLVYAVAVCKAPDGSYWALQSWQRSLPHRGFPPWRPDQTAWELRVSHWTGALASLEVYTDWAFRGAAHDLFGRLRYAGAPVHGFHTTSTGVPKDSYGRNLYIDTWDSVYGPGWKRETSILFRKPSGAFCYSFWPTNDRSLPGAPRRPVGKGKRYRISVVGPGVTPDVAVVVPGLHDFDPRDPADVAYERRQNALFDEVTAGDAFCRTQH